MGILDLFKKKEAKGAAPEEKAPSVEANPTAQTQVVQPNPSPAPIETPQAPVQVAPTEPIAPQVQPQVAGQAPVVNQPLVTPTVDQNEQIQPQVTNTESPISTGINSNNMLENNPFVETNPVQTQPVAPPPQTEPNFDNIFNATPADLIQTPSIQPAEVNTDMVAPTPVEHQSIQPQVINESGTIAPVIDPTLEVSENNSLDNEKQNAEDIVPAVEDTAALIDNPKPIVEQQIALNVNPEEVFEGGPNKEDEITNIVSDTVKQEENEVASETNITSENPKPNIEAPTVEENPVEQPIDQNQAIAPIENTDVNAPIEPTELVPASSEVSAPEQQEATENIPNQDVVNNDQSSENAINPNTDIAPQSENIDIQSIKIETPQEPIQPESTQEQPAIAPEVITIEATPEEKEEVAPEQPNEQAIQPNIIEPENQEQEMPQTEIIQPDQTPIESNDSVNQNPDVNSNTVIEPQASAPIENNEETTIAPIDNTVVSEPSINIEAPIVPENTENISPTEENTPNNEVATEQTQEEVKESTPVESTEPKVEQTSENNQPETSIEATTTEIPQESTPASTNEVSEKQENPVPASNPVHHKTRFCDNCGTMITDDATSCPNCGEPLN